MSGQYHDNPTSGGGPSSSRPDLNQEYFDSGIPPPHRFLGADDRASNTVIHPASDSAARGDYTATDMHPDNKNYANMDGPYGRSEYSNSQWLEKQEARSRRSKRIVIGSVVALIALIVVGVAVGVTVAKKNSKGSTKLSSGSGSDGNSTAPAGTINQTDPNDPSTFVKDPRLKHSFYGLAYTPEGSQLPECGSTLESVIEDIQLLSQLTSRIRLYGADCNQSAMVLEAIQRTKVDMNVYLGNYNIPTDPAPYERQRDAIQQAIQTYGTDHIAGITVGNEFMLNYLNANGGTVPNSDIGNAGAALLIPNITDTRNMLTSLNLAKTIPVGNADAGSYFNNEVLAAVDYGMSNVHPWFANVSIDIAAGWTNEFFQENNVIVAQGLANKPQMFIAETGWPTKSSDAGNANNGPSLASEQNLQEFLDTFVCQANQNGTGYFFFEYFDEPWKDAQFGGVEGWWGLFNSNKTLKNLEIPDCHID